MAIRKPFAVTSTIYYDVIISENIIPVSIYKQFSNVTLNYKYNILPTITPSERPKIQYYGIGIKGFKNLDTDQSAAPYVPQPFNADLYEPLPVKVLPKSEDLNMDPTERSKYRIRIEKEINGQIYVCYYLRKLDFSSNEVKIYEIDLDTGNVEEITEFNSSYLNPIPSLTEATVSEQYNKKLVVEMEAVINLYGAEILNAVNILYNGDLTKAKISEIGLYMGIDQTNNTGELTYTESVGTLLAYHFCYLGDTFFSEEDIITRKVSIGTSSVFLL